MCEWRRVGVTVVVGGLLLAARHTVGIGGWPGCVGFYSYVILISVFSYNLIPDFPSCIGKRRKGRGREGKVRY